ncbi:MAG TPA: CARDB domain-containing protein, partial [Candidatus Binatia bacterium]|nr:CARDB domain-containing protein [Candidatus Binatia bacterium]
MSFLSRTVVKTALAKIVLFSWALAFLTLNPDARAQTTLLSEGFEGAFPGSWAVDDVNPEGDPAYWKDVPNNFGSVRPHTGSWMGYCAGVGFAGPTFVPNYQSYMTAIMQRSVNLAGATSASLTFWFNIPSIESCCDRCAVAIDGTAVEVYRSATAGWQQATISLDPYVGTSVVIGFAFLSDDSVEFEGWYLDDILVTASGIAQQPNLIPYQPAGWSDEIVVSKVTGTRLDDSNLQPSDTLYIDAAVANNGAGTVNAGFTTELYVDNVLRTSWSTSPPMGVGSYTFITDYNIGSLAAGIHTIRIKADSASAASESNETDNEYTKTITISGAPDIGITPLTLNFNVTNPPGGAPSAPQTLSVESAAEEMQMASAEQLLVTVEAQRRFDQGEERIRVIVNLVSPPEKPRGPDWNSKAKLDVWQRAIKSRQDEVLSALAAAEFRVRHRFENQSGFSAAVTRQGFEKLTRHPRVASIQLAREVKPYLAQGIPLMNAAVYRSTYNGSGVSVAIVDSGVDYNHPRLGGGGFPNTKVIGGYDFGNSDADPGPDGDSHG